MVANSDSEQMRHQATKLDALLADSDGLLARSLTQEDRNRRKRQWWTIAISCSLVSAGCLLALFIFATPAILAGDKATEGWRLWSQRRVPEAEAKFREALMENDKDSNAWVGLGWSLTNTGRLKEATDAFQKSLVLTPDNISAQNGLGQCALGLGDLALAEESLKKSGEGLAKLAGGEDKLTADNLPAAWYGLVNVYLLKDDFDQAKQWADRIAKIKPTDEVLKSMLEQITKRDSTATKQMFGRETPKAQPADANSKSKAWQLWGSGQLDQALAMFQASIKSDPKDADAHNGAGWCLLNSGKAKEAHEMFKHCLAIDGKHAAALNGAGQSALALHDWKVAEEFLGQGSERFLEQIPESKLSPQSIPAAWFGLANVHLVQGNFDKAMEWGERILKHDPNNVTAKELVDNARRKDNSSIKKMYGL